MGGYAPHNFKRIGGVKHKICTGPAHNEPAWLPATDKYFAKRKSGARKGQLISRCRLCTSWRRHQLSFGELGLVPVASVLPFYREAVNRIGMMELAKRTGVHWQTISNVLHGKVKNVRKSNARLVMLELISAKRKREVANPRAHVHNRRRLQGWAETPEQADEDNPVKCKRCGIPVNRYTDGCVTCRDRRLRRESYARRSPEKVKLDLAKNAVEKRARYRKQKLGV